MQELSLNILDIAQNSIAADATLVKIQISVTDPFLTITIADNGKGMSKEILDNVASPFCTHRTSRRVGLGIPFFKQAAEATNGSFSVESTPGVGTTVTAVFDTSHIDYTPLGDVYDTIAILIQMNDTLDFVYTVKKLNQEFVCDTKELREIMGDTPLSDLTVVKFIKDFIKENQFEILKRRY